MIFKRNVALSNFNFVLINKKTGAATTNTPATTVNGYIRKDGTSAALTNSPTYDGTAMCWAVNFTQAEMDGAILGITFQEANSIDVHFTIVTETYKMADLPQAIWDVATSALVTAGSIGKGIVDFLSALVSNKVVLASTTHTGAVIPTVTTTTTATSVTNDVGITQDGADKVWGTTVRTITGGTISTIASGAITAASFAANALDAVWSTVTRTITGGVISSGTVTSVTNDVGITQVGADKVWNTGTKTITGGTISTIASGAITAASFAANALDAVWSTVTRTITGGVISSGTVTSVTNDVGITQVGADKVWTSTVGGRTLTGFGTLVADIWNYLLSNITTPLSIGLKLKDLLVGSDGAVILSNTTHNATISNVTTVATTTNVTNNVGITTAGALKVWDTLLADMGAELTIGAKVKSWVLGSDNKAVLSSDIHSSGVTVAAVTGSVGSVSGNVDGSVGSVAGNVSGNVGGDVQGKVNGSVGSVAGNVTGSVGSVAGDVEGDVVGSVGSLDTQAKADVKAEADQSLLDYGIAGVAQESSVQDVDTEVDLIKTVIDKIDTTLQSDGGAGYQFTETALENGTFKAADSTKLDEVHDAIFSVDYGLEHLDGELDLVHDCTDEVKGKVNLLVYTSESIWIDLDKITSGTTVGTDGTPFNPVNSLADAAILAAATNLRKYMFVGTGLITLDKDYFDWKFESRGSHTIDVAGYDISGSWFIGFTMTGAQGLCTGNVPYMTTCGFDAYTNAQILSEYCYIYSSITFGPGQSDMVYPVSSQSGLSPVTVGFEDVSGGTPPADFVKLNLSGYVGGLELVNMGINGSNHSASIRGSGMRLRLAASCDGGSINLVGMAHVEDLSGGAVTVNYVNVVDPPVISEYVWNMLLAEMDLADSVGNKLRLLGVGTDGNLLLSAQTHTGAVIPDVTTVGEVTGSVGSVAGDVEGDVVGSVGSLDTQAKVDVMTQLEDYDSGNGVAKESTLAGLKFTTPFNVIAPGQVVKPDTGSTRYKFMLYYYDENGVPKDPDSNDIGVLVQNREGGSENGLLYKLFSGGSNLDASSYTDHLKAERQEAGIYYFFLEISDTETHGQFTYDFVLEISAVQYRYAFTHAILDASVNSVDITDNDDNKIVIAKAIKGFNASGITEGANSIYADVMRNIDEVDATVDSTALEVTAIHGETTGIKSQTDKLAFSGAGPYDVKATLDGEKVDVASIDNAAKTGFSLIPAYTTFGASQASVNSIDSKVNSIKNQTDKVAFSGTGPYDVKATLDGEEVVVAAASKTGFFLNTAEHTSIAAAVWAAGSRTLSSFGTLVSDIWSYLARTLTDKTGFSLTSGERGLIADAVVDESLTGHTVPNSLGTNVDTTISSRLAASSYVDVSPMVKLTKYQDSAIWIDLFNGVSGQIVGTHGTPFTPVNNITDAVALAAATGLRKYRLKGGTSITLTTPHPNWTFIGDGLCYVDLGGQDVSNSMFQSLAITGTQGRGTLFDSTIQCLQCGLVDIQNFWGVALNCILIGNITIKMEESLAHTLFFDCRNAVPVPVIDIVGTVPGVIAFSAYCGDFKVQNLRPYHMLIADFLTGYARLESSCTGGNLILSGLSFLDNQGTGINILSQESALSRQVIADMAEHGVWDALRSAHITPDSFGAAIDDTITSRLAAEDYIDPSSSIDILYYDQSAVWIDTVSGSAGHDVGVNGTPQNPVNNMTDAGILASTLKFKKYIVQGASTITLTIPHVGWTFVGNGRCSVNLNNQDVSNSWFENIAVAGIQGNGTASIQAVTCVLYGAQNLSIIAKDCALYGNCSIREGSNFFANCIASYPVPSITFLDPIHQTLAQFENFSGEIEVRGMTAAHMLILDGPTSKLTIHSSCNGGTVVRRGLQELVNNGTSMILLEEASLDRTLLAELAGGFTPEDRENLSSMASDMTQIEGDITSIEGSIASVPVDLQNLNNSMQSLETSVTTDLETLTETLHTDMDELSADVTDLTNRIRPQPAVPKVVVGSGYVPPSAGATMALLNPMYEEMFGGVAFTFPDVYYIALWCAPLDVNATNATVGEVTAPSYERSAFQNIASNFTEMIGNEKRNAVEIAFPVATEDWGIVTHVAILDAASEGNILFYSELSTPKEVVSGDQFKFPVSSLRMVIPV